MSDYAVFRQVVMHQAMGLCENPHCDAEADGVHHFFKRSTFPQYKLAPWNGMAVCGSCHEEIERRQREKLAYEALYPLSRYLQAIEKAMLGTWLDLRIFKVDESFARSEVEVYCMDQWDRNVLVKWHRGVVQLKLEGQTVIDTVTDFNYRSNTLTTIMRRYRVDLPL